MNTKIVLTLLCLTLVGCAAQVARTEPGKTIDKDQLLEVATVLEQQGDSLRAEQYLHAALREDGQPVADEATDVGAASDASLDG